MIHWAEKYLGIPWLSGGRNASEGLDCWGLLCHIYKCEFNIDIPAYNVPVGTLAKPETIATGELDNSCWFEVKDPASSDVVILGNSNRFTHVGVYVEIPDAAIIHSAKNCLSCIVTLRILTRYGYTRHKFYRHVDSHIH